MIKENKKVKKTRIKTLSINKKRHIQEKTTTSKKKIIRLKKNRKHALEQESDQKSF